MREFLRTMFKLKYQKSTILHMRSVCNKLQKINYNHHHLYVQCTLIFILSLYFISVHLIIKVRTVRVSFRNKFTVYIRFGVKAASDSRL